MKLQLELELELPFCWYRPGGTGVQQVLCLFGDEGYSAKYSITGLLICDTFQKYIFIRNDLIFIATINSNNIPHLQQ
jgi:hypothetical protein